MYSRLFILSLLFIQPLMGETKVLLFSGSLRKESYNTKLIQEAAAVAKSLGAKATIIDLADYPIPFYNGDIEAKEGMPENARRIRDAMIDAQVICIASPEYNSSVSSVLKNTLDWASRSEAKSSSRKAFKGKTFVLLSASPSSLGGSRGLVHLRNIIEDIGGTCLEKQLSVARAQEAFDDQGNLKDPQTKQKLQELLKEAIK